MTNHGSIECWPSGQFCTLLEIDTKIRDRYENGLSAGAGRGRQFIGCWGRYASGHPPPSYHGDISSKGLDGDLSLTPSLQNHIVPFLCGNPGGSAGHQLKGRCEHKKAARGIGAATSSSFPDRRNLLDPSALEETCVRCVLFDVRRVALFIGVLRMVFFVRCVSRGFGIWGYTLVAPICGRDRRHTTGHSISLATLKRSTLDLNAASYENLFHLWLSDCWNVFGYGEFVPAGS